MESFTLSSRPRYIHVAPVIALVLVSQQDYLHGVAERPGACDCVLADRPGRVVRVAVRIVEGACPVEHSIKARANAGTSAARDDDRPVSE